MAEIDLAGIVQPSRPLRGTVKRDSGVGAARTAAEGRPMKKDYKTPTLEIHGTVESITRADWIEKCWGAADGYVVNGNPITYCS
jgi:hypothetical protein